MKTSRLIAFLTVLAVLLSAQVSRAAGIVIIANSSVQESSIDAGSIQKIFLGKKSTWSDGSKVIPVMLQSGATREAFLKDFVQKSESDFKTFWMQNIFAGKGTPPKNFNTEAELVKFVQDTPGAVGFVAAGTATGNTKTLAVK